MNLLPGTMLGTEGPWARVRLAGVAEVLADPGGVRLYPGAAVAVGVRPADLRIVDAGVSHALRGRVVGIERREHAVLVRIELGGPEGGRRELLAECAADAGLPAPDSTVGLVFDPACGRVGPAAGRPPMRRGPDGPYLKNLQGP